MIFATVGSMLPFDRFVQGVDEWAGNNPDVTVYIQIGAGDYLPVHAEYTRMMPMAEYRQRLRDSKLFVAHVGMGSILQALEDRKQMLLMPRRQDLGEHTTDHQLHTAARFGQIAGLRIAETVPELQRDMSKLLRSPLAVGDAISTQASPQLIEGVTGFLSQALAGRR